MRMSKAKISSFVLASLLSAGSFGAAQAAGFALIEMNANGQGNAYAGAAAYTPNASTVYFNPAGMMSLEGEQISIATHYIEPTSDFTNKGSTLSPFVGGGPISGDEDDGGESAIVPNFYWVKPLNDDTSFGLGVNSPFGLKTEYDDEWVGRYHAILSDLKTININPSLGHRVNDKISIGGGINIMLADVELSSAIDFGSICATIGAACASPGDPDLDGLGELEADNFDDVGLGFNVGFTFMASDVTTIGVHYRSKVDIDVDGDAYVLDARSPGGARLQNVYVVVGSKYVIGVYEEGVEDAQGVLKLAAAAQGTCITCPNGATLCGHNPRCR